MGFIFQLLLFHLSLLCCVLVSPLSTFLKNNWKDEKDRRATMMLIEDTLRVYSTHIIS
jgi:Na+-transporting NADH:ubiquinone oxidoreductase subunit NqrC